MTNRARKRQDAWRKTNKLNVTFNTHKAAKALKSSGFDEKQAESVVETIDKAVNETVATKTDLALLAAKMATKDDLKALATKDELKALATKEELKALATKDDLKALATKDELKPLATKEELRALRKTVKTEIANLETRMLRMMLLQTLVLVGTLGTLIVAVVKLL